jgi:hypothetical protein
MCTEFKGNTYTEIMLEINTFVKNKENELINRLPDYAFAYEDGDKYIRSGYKIGIEKQIEIYRNQCLNDALKYSMERR